MERNSPFEIGDRVFIRMVNYHVTGEVVEYRGDFIVLDHAAWIADSGRFADALKSCEFAEVEPFADRVLINLSAITDATWIDTLPIKQK